jgi:hypothetical protein
MSNKNETPTEREEIKKKPQPKSLTILFIIVAILLVIGVFNAPDEGLFSYLWNNVSPHSESKPSTISKKSKHTKSKPKGLSREEKSNFAKVIRIKGYVCNSCSNGYSMGTQHKGMVFRILCNDDALTYRVTLTPNDTFIVEPWKY